MDENSAVMESELLDLSAENVATLRSADLSGITGAIERVRETIADSEGAISGYSGSTGRPVGSGSEAEDHVD